MTNRTTFLISADPCEQPCQNIPGPNVGSAPSGGPAIAPAASTSTSNSSINNVNLNPPNVNGLGGAGSSSSSGSSGIGGSNGGAGGSGGSAGSSSSGSGSNLNNPVVVPSTCSTTSPSGSSGSSPPAATATNSHQSPYDLRKKSPTANHNDSSWPAAAGGSGGNCSGGVGGCNSAGPSTSNCQPCSSQSAQAHQYQSMAAMAGGSSSGCGGNSGSNSGGGSSDGCYLLPARKRPRRIYSTCTDTTVTSAAHYLQYEMPDEVLLTIFSYLLEQDLCRLSLVCKRFNTIANDTELWKRLYQSVYEYDLPLFNPESCKFHFIKPEDSDYANPWKESFRQLYRGIHVRPGYEGLKYKGRSISYCNTVQAALDYADERTSAMCSAASNSLNAGNSTSNSVNSMSCASSSSASNASSSMITDDNSIPENPGSLIFLHSGHYRGEFLVIDSDVALIGAAAGNVAESIVLERESESTVMFVEGAKHAYVGHMTLKFSPDVTSTVPHHKHYCLEVGENCSPTIDHCIIRSTSVGKYN